MGAKNVLCCFIDFGQKCYLSLFHELVVIGIGLFSIWQVGKVNLAMKDS